MVLVPQPHVIMDVIELVPASPTEGQRALQEVKEFAVTDMGWGGNDRWTYRLLSEEQINPELAHLCQPATCGLVDSVSFQPCVSYEARSQDRHVVQTWDLPGGQWTFLGVFDGHCSHETVDYAVDHLPGMVKHALWSTLDEGPASPDVISRLLVDAIINLDNTITSQFLDMFPGRPEGLSSLTDEQLDAVIFEQDKYGQAFLKAIRCLRGTTVLVVLVDSNNKNFWVANLGDCVAALVSKTSSGRWQAERINEVHNGSNVRELQRIADEHPNEEECVIDSRVLGFLAPTRAVGNTWMKIPAEFSRRVLMRFKDSPNFQLSHQYIERILTPPYLSNVPDVYHRQSRTGTADTAVDVDMAIILCSDGLTDLYEDQLTEDSSYLNSWAKTVGEGIMAPPTTGGRQNLAMRLLRNAIGGSDLQKVSRNLTVEMDDRWIDDTTILVHRFA